MALTDWVDLSDHGLKLTLVNTPVSKRLVIQGDDAHGHLAAFRGDVKFREVSGRPDLIVHALPLPEEGNQHWVPRLYLTKVMNAFPKARLVPFDAAAHAREGHATGRRRNVDDARPTMAASSGHEPGPGARGGDVEHVIEDVEDLNEHAFRMG